MDKTHNRGDSNGYKKNRSMLVWKRIHQLKEQNGTDKQKNMEVKNAQWKIVSTLPEILQQMKEHIKSDHYRKPEALECLTIPEEIRRNSHRQGNEHIRPNINIEREHSGLRKYIKSEHGAGDGINLTTSITLGEIKIRY